MIPISKPSIGNDEIKAVEDVLRSGFIVQHKKTKEFERRFSKYIGAKHGIATSSGTSALMVALDGLGITEGDEVITTAFSFAATANSIMYVGAKPVFADIDPKTYNLNPDSIEEKITENTKAVMPVHLYGQPCDMKRIEKIAHDNGLLIVEDACQAHGAEYHGKRAGSFGDASCFSFYATKNLVTAEGGMILTNNNDLFEKTQLIRNHGQLGTYEHHLLSYNFRMTDINAALGLSQLNRLDEMNMARARNAEFFTKNLKDIDWLETPLVPDGIISSWHQYTLKILENKRDDLVKHLEDNGVGCRIYYPAPIYMQPFYKSIGFKEGICPISERIAKEVISIPVGPHVTDENRARIVEIMHDFS